MYHSAYFTLMAKVTTLFFSIHNEYIFHSSGDVLSLCSGCEFRGNSITVYIFYNSSKKLRNIVKIKTACIKGYEL